MSSFQHAQRPLHIPPLPERHDGRLWSGDVMKGFQIVCSAYDGSSQLLRLEDGDPIRLRLHSERLTSRVLPVLRALADQLQDEAWCACAISAFTALVNELDYAASSTDRVYVIFIIMSESTELTNFTRLQETLTKESYVTTVQTGKRGRPAIVIDPELLREAASLNHKLTLSELARILGVHRHTLRRQFDQLDLPRLSSYSAISDADLDELIRAYKQVKPNSGTRYVMGYLGQCGIRLQRRRVQDALRRIDALGQVLRNHAAIDRRVYTVPYPNYLWHIDGHHKLIRWGIVIHGGADGFDRMVSRPVYR